MLYYSFKNFDEFKSIFRIEKRDGITVRKNKILLAHLKNPELFRYCQETGDYSLLRVKDMAGLRNMVFKAVCESGKEDESLPNKIELMGKEYWSARYKTDEMQGICEDGDKCSIRYVNTEQGKAFKMKSSKFMRAVMLETQAGKALSPSVVNWICGDVFAKEWHTFTYGCTCGMKLHVDGDFRKIYDSGECRGDFDSCMTDRDRHPFYMYAVRAKAAYLTDEDGRIVARAVLFTDVTDQDGRKWRLLERQYATGRDDMLKYILINKLIQEKQIDGYKIVGASCNEANAFVSVDGQSLSDMKFEIGCNLGMDDVLSYQDSFKWYDIMARKAYNYPYGEDYYELDTTDRNLCGDEDDNGEESEEWDEYHQYYCEETRTCYRSGLEISVDVDCLDDFDYIESRNEYYHRDDTACCGCCGEHILKEDGLYSELTREYCCCELCKWDAENQYRKEFMGHTDYELCAKPDGTAEIVIWNEQAGAYRKFSIRTAVLDKLIMELRRGYLNGQPIENPDERHYNSYLDSFLSEVSYEYDTFEEAV